MEKHYIWKSRQIGNSDEICSCGYSTKHYYFLYTSRNTSGLLPKFNPANNSRPKTSIIHQGYHRCRSSWGKKKLSTILEQIRNLGNNLLPGATRQHRQKIQKNTNQPSAMNVLHGMVIFFYPINTKF